jgi:hypothetical protein
MRDLYRGAQVSRCLRRRPLQRLVPSYQKSGSGIREKIDDITLLWIIRDGAARAGIFLPLPGRDEAQEQTPRRLLLHGRQGRVGALCRLLNCSLDATHLCVSLGCEAVFLASLPCLLQRKLKQRQAPFLGANVIQNLINQGRRSEEKPRFGGRRLNCSPQVAGRHWRYVHLLPRQQLTQQGMSNERVVEVRTHREHGRRPRLLTGCSRDQQRDEFVDIARMLLTLLRVLCSRRHGIKLLPLIDVDQEPVGLLGRRIEAVVDNTSKFACVALTIGCGFVLKVGVGRGRASFFRHYSEGVAKARSGDAPGRNDTTSQIVVSRCWRSAGSRPAKTSDDLPLPEGPTTATNEFVWI